jgi:hypothetical protein
MFLNTYIDWSNAMTKIHRIPRAASAGVVFLGVELSETMPLVVSVFLALPLSSGGSWVMPLLSVSTGFFMTKAYVEFKKSHLNGYLQTLLYAYGIDGYSAVLNRQKKVFIGDACMSNPSLLTSILSQKKH